MAFLLTYVLQVNLLLVIVYLGYALLLKNLTFYQINRAYFIVGIGFSFLYPFLDIKALFRQHIEPMGEVIHYIPEFFVEQSVGTSVFTLNNLSLTVLAVGAAVFVVRLLMQLLSLLRIHLKSEPAIWKSFIYRNVLFPIVPFSFFNKIYINKQQHEERELLDIFKHEDIHVKGRHTFDILFTEIVLITCWYNPAVWLMRKAVRQNLEFLTDQQVLDKGVDRQVYQYSLLNVSKQGANAAIANQFNFKMLKRRIMMMNKKRSSKLELSKYVFLIPVFVFVAGAFTVSKADDKIIEVVGYAKSTDMAKVLHKPEVENDVIDVLESNVSDGDEKNGFMLDGKIVERKAIEALNAVDIENVIANIDNSLTKQYGYKSILNITTKKFAGTEGTPSKIKSIAFDDIGELVIGGPLQMASDKPVSYDGGFRYESDVVDTSRNPRVTIRRTTGEKPLFVVDDKLMGSDYDVGQVNVHEIESITVFKDSTATHLYGEEGKNGVVVIKTKKAAAKSSDTTQVRLRGTIGGVGIVQGRLIDSLGNEKKPLIVVDGEPLMIGGLNSINPNDIASMTVLKDETSKVIYGEKAKHGVILITTKKIGGETQSESNKLSEVVVQGYAINKSANKPLVIVNGEVKALDLNSINTENIESIKTLTKEEATALYGEKGKNGAVIVVTKVGREVTLRSDPRVSGTGRIQTIAVAGIK